MKAGNSKLQKLIPLLLHWFCKNARDLPWRRTHDPYAIWVSEIMLQQTQVKTVIPYWERWMRELPTIESLAKARPDRIHKLWEGLGYYTRVRNLQKAARQIIASQSAVAADVSPLHLRAGKDQSRPTSAATIRGSKHRLSRPAATLSSIRNGGEGRGEEASRFMQSARVRGFPTDFDTILALPGIGRYTAGAICSIAFNQPTPILDGNVIRVLTRIHGIKTDPREKQTNAQLWQLAEELVTHAHEWWGECPREPHSRNSKPARQESRPTNSCSHLNQSLMELGALICTPRSPNCATCPVHKLCVAHKENLQNQLPNLGKRKAATERRFLAFVVERDGKFLVWQRPANVVNAHLWEFPNVEVETSKGRARHAVRAAPLQTQTGTQRTDAPCQHYDFHITSAKPLHVVKHSITRYRITLEAWRAELNGAPISTPAQRESAGKHALGQRPAPHGVWLTAAECESLAFTSAHKKIRSKLGHAAD